MKSDAKATVLVVDDTDSMRYATARNLKNAGIEVIEAATGTEALNIAAAKVPSLIILDVQLPDIEGFEVCARLKSNPATSFIPVLQTSAFFTSSKDRVYGLGVGADCYLISPYEPDELVATVKAMIRSSLRERENNLKLEVELKDYTRNMESLVSQRTEQLESATQALKEICNAMAHDLQAPLRSMGGFANILQTDYAREFDEAGREYGNRIISSASRMSKLVKALMTYAHLAQAELSCRNLDLTAHINVVKDRLKDSIGKSAKIEVIQPLPDVYGDAHFLILCLENLIENSLKHVRSGATPHIIISAERLPGTVRVSIKDHGIGIDPAYHEKVFGVFENRLSPDSTAEEGTGMGLAIVRIAMQRMHGSVSVSSQVGAGSTFHLDFPSHD